MRTKTRVRKNVLGDWGSPRLEKGFYSRTFREHLVEQDALSNEEAGFMQGYEDWEEMF